MKGKNLKVFFIVFLFITCQTMICSAQDDLKEHKSCKNCGMDRTMFSHSRMLVTFEDGTTVGTCSLHCMSLELGLSIDKTPNTIEVADYNTKKLINADTAYWVLGGSKPGVMTKRAKWAFANKIDAETFVKENGGIIKTFDEVNNESYGDMNTDTKMIREKRKMKKMQSTQ